jgi:hypothetical protein
MCNFKMRKEKGGNKTKRKNNQNNQKAENI